MRPLLVRLHRWFGLATAGFLFIAGLTGAIIAWDHELDAALNPTFYRAATPGAPLHPLELARRLEASDPRLVVSYLPLQVEAGNTLIVGVTPRVDPRTGQPYTLGFTQVALDPVTAAVQGRREWGAVSLKRLDLLPFVYKLHYTLHLPILGGIDLGTWLMGIVGITWIFDGMVALVLAFPSAKSWRKSFAFRLRRGGHALVFDLHRSGGVWVWGLLLVLAVTSVSMNLSTPVVRPLVSLLSPLSTTPFTNPTGREPLGPTETALSRERIVEMATAAERGEGLTEPPGAIFFAPTLAAYGVGYFGAGNEHGDIGLGNAWLYWDARTGALVGRQVPGKGSAGDLFMQVQFPLHSGRIAGMTGRVIISAMGIVVAMLSLTGILIWFKKARARRRSAPALSPSRSPLRT